MGGVYRGFAAWELLVRGRLPPGPNTIPQLNRVACPRRVPLLAAYLPQNDSPPGPRTEGVARIKIKNRYAEASNQKLTCSCVRRSHWLPVVEFVPLAFALFHQPV